MHKSRKEFRMKTEEPRLVPTHEDEFAAIKNALNAYRTAITKADTALRIHHLHALPLGPNESCSRSEIATRWHLRWAEDALAQLQLMVETDLKHVRQLSMAGARARLDFDDTLWEYETPWDVVVT
jgi:hypothetical protein